MWTTDRMIGHVMRGERGWHVVGDSEHQYEDADTLSNLIQSGRVNGF
ncbi:hypothetical protein J2W45_001156 [Leifsonia shinshuensis]|nr:hypothetical protein [Leifsonia shinshuensis]